MTSSILHEAAAGRAILRKWTTDEYRRAIVAGSLEEDPAFELLDGFIVRKDRAKAGENPITIGDRHRIVVTRLVQLASSFAPHGCFLQSQQPITLPPDGEPEPDASIIRGTVEDFSHRPPGAMDVTCVIEVADSSLVRDMGTKLRMYARAGIVQYVVVDLVNNLVHDHRRPTGESYAAVIPLGRGSTVQLSSAGAESVSVPTDRLLP